MQPADPSHPGPASSPASHVPCPAKQRVAVSKRVAVSRAPSMHSLIRATARDRLTFLASTARWSPSAARPRTREVASSPPWFSTSRHTECRLPLSSMSKHFLREGSGTRLWGTAPGAAVDSGALSRERHYPLGQEQQHFGPNSHRAQWALVFRPRFRGRQAPRCASQTGGSKKTQEASLSAPPCAM